MAPVRGVAVSGSREAVARGVAVSGSRVAPVRGLPWAIVAGIAVGEAVALAVEGVRREERLDGDERVRCGRVKQIRRAGRKFY